MTNPITAIAESLDNLKELQKEDHSYLIKAMEARE